MLVLKALLYKEISKQVNNVQFYCTIKSEVTEALNLNLNMRPLKTSGGHIEKCAMCSNINTFSQFTKLYHITRQTSVFLSAPP